MRNSYCNLASNTENRLEVVKKKNGHPRAVYHVAVQHFGGHRFIRLVALDVQEIP
jgi:hypothetical protein